jgi:hypothetical protein
MEKRGMTPLTRRDLTIVPLGNQDCLVIACDSCGGIGLKDNDILKLPPRYSAKFTARVALTEVMCGGARPVTLTNGAACEMNPTGEEMILGIKDELQNAGLGEIVLTGSTEENFTTSMTALAITVVGIAKRKDLKFGQAVSGDKLILLGKPKLGAEVDLESAGFYADIRRLLLNPLVREIVPAGSKGVKHEAKTLAVLNNLAFKPWEADIDFLKSAGPATCLLVLCAGPAVSEITESFKEAVVIGELVERA